MPEGNVFLMPFKSQALPSPGTRLRAGTPLSTLPGTRSCGQTPPYKLSSILSNTLTTHEADLSQGLSSSSSVRDWQGAMQDVVVSRLLLWAAH